jgi:hypothetical protein
MILSLDHQQRLNLVGLLGTQRTTVGEMRTLWKLMDRIDLTEDERHTIGYKVETVNGAEVSMWDRTRKLEPKGFEFTDAEAARVRKVIEEWPHFFTSTDRLWLEPLLAQLPAAAENGQPKQLQQLQ